MSYYVVKTSFESGEVNKNGDPVYKKAEFLRNNTFFAELTR